MKSLKKKKKGLFWKVTRKSNAPSLKNFFFLIFKWLKGSMPLVQRHFFLFFENFSLFWERFGNLEIFFWIFFFVYFKYIYIYIHEQSTSNSTWIFRIQRNIETRNKQTNFKLNHDVANQMWSEAKLDHLLLLIHLGCLSLGMLEPW